MLTLSRKRNIAVIFIVLFGICQLYLQYLTKHDNPNVENTPRQIEAKPHMKTNPENNKRPIETRPPLIGHQIKKPKVILAWNGRFGRDNWGFDREPIKSFVKNGCPVTNCVVTDDKARLNESDAVMFHMFDSVLTRPTYKLPNQRWVYFMHEPPCNVKTNLKPWNGWFNWTMTYRSDNTIGNIPMQYGTVCGRDKPIKIDFKSIVKKKTKFAAWMVNNCKSTGKREDYVKELLKYIPIDIYGVCGKDFNQLHVCKRSEEKVCRKMLDRDYKFYLSFENSFATGYITEKYFKSLAINTVPIVRGDGSYDVVGPPHSYINTKDFDSPKQLADYLKRLDQNDDEYIEYLKWKEMYTAFEGDEDLDCQPVKEFSFCLLCKKLNDPSEPRHVYDDIEKWWGICRKPTDI